MSNIHAEEKSREEFLQENSEAILERSLRFALQFYTMAEGEDIKEITQAVLESNDTKENIKQRIVSSGRRFFLFKYPSDEVQVKGYISFVPNASKNPLLIILRGGNRILGLMHPATDLSCAKDYTVIATAYRGGISEGVDQFGGNEVNDVEYLRQYLPILSQKLQLDLQPEKQFIIGKSRGAMEMFLALGRFPSLQQQVSKVVSLSGLLDIQETIHAREDMRSMFIEDFGLIPNENEEQWIEMRNPISVVPNIRKDLPILVIQGASDIRVGLKEGYHMIEKLKKNGNDVDYLEIAEGDHCLENIPNRMDFIIDWFEK